MLSEVVPAISTNIPLSFLFLTRRDLFSPFQTLAKVISETIYGQQETLSYRAFTYLIFAKTSQLQGPIFQVPLS